MTDPTPLPCALVARHPELRPWLAAGVQLAVLARAMPTVRHDLAAPLSVMRMGSTVLKRRLAQPPLDAAALTERVEQIEAHLTGLGHDLRRLRHWDVRVAERGAPAAIAAEAIGLARPPLQMRGTVLEWGEDAQATEKQDAEDVDLHATLYVLLAAIFLLAEAAAPPARIVLLRQGADLVVQASGSAPADAAPLPAAGGTLPLDDAALRCLAEHLGVPLRLQPGQVAIGLRLAA